MVVVKPGLLEEFVERQESYFWTKNVIYLCLEEIFLVLAPNNKRDRATLEKIILDNVAIGTTIFTDGWASYTDIESHGYKWDFVNHSEEFVK